MSGGTCTVEVVLGDASGLHARPAAAIVDAAGAFDSQIWLRHGDRSVEVTSMVKLLSLGISGGATVQVHAEGADAADACDRLASLLSATPRSEVASAETAPISAVAPTWRARFEHQATSGLDPMAAMAEAVSRLHSQMEGAEGESADILAGLAHLARDDALAEAVRAGLSAGREGEAVVEDAFDRLASELRDTGDHYIAERAVDLVHLRDLVLDLIRGESKMITLPDYPVILVARDLSPTQVAGLDPDIVYGLVLEAAGPTSHAVMVARARGMPVVTGVTLDLEDGTVVELDPTTGEVSVTDVKLVQPPTRRRSGREPGKGESPPTMPACLGANVGSHLDAAEARDLGANFIGLYRTELAFLAHPRPPTIAEMDADLEAVQSAFGGSVTVRTFDFGADKMPAFMSLPPEPNPALGVRGIRLAKAHGDLLDRQLESVRRAASRGPVSVMAPMIANQQEAAWFSERARRICGDEVQIGVMIEVPSAVVDIEGIAAHVDFVSVGTNDLTQYLFAADRHIGALEELNDPYAPQVLKALESIVNGAGSYCAVAVCGAAAGEPGWARFASALGVSSLSMDPKRLAPVAVRLSSEPQLESSIMAKALGAADARSVRALLQ